MITILCVGKIKEKYLSDMIEDYQKRINKYHKLDVIEVNDDINKDNETKNILNKLDKKSFIICTCLDGKKLTSIELSKKIDSIFIQNSHITFLIGGSTGLDDKILDHANFKLSFSDLTFPHGMFRAILLEQIYRSFKIINNESYHK